jgi:uncharacterized membrane protein
LALELKVPHGATLDALLPPWPVFLSYVFSFIYLGIYWNKLQYASPPFDMKITLLVLAGLALIALSVRFDSRRRTAKVEALFAGRD